MSVKPIAADMWPEILRLQREAHSSVEPESKAVLQSKWLRSPEVCFVYQDNEQISGYLLAHTWSEETPPSLFKLLPEKRKGFQLFLHDLVVCNSASGRGIGSKLLEHLVRSAILQGYETIRLVSVQDSSMFWEKLGFIRVDRPVCGSYGEGAQLMQRVLLL